MALVNPGLSPIILAPPAGKDSRWLTLEVCREFARSKCSRTEEECKYAHPPAHVEIQNGRVTCCFDSIKGKCQRKDPPCKYLHPPQHLKEILLQNGRQNLMLKNLQMQATIRPVAVQVPTVYPVMPPGTASHPYLMPSPLGYTYYNPQNVGSYPAVVPTYDAAAACTIPVTMGTSQMMAPLPNTQTVANGLTQQLFMGPSSVAKQLESSSGSSGSPSSVNHQGSQPPLPWDGSLSPSRSIIAVESANTPYCQPIYYKSMNAVPGMLSVLKRPALMDAKSGLPVYRQIAAASTYPQTLAAVQFQKAQFVPITNFASYP